MLLLPFPLMFLWEGTSLKLGAKPCTEKRRSLDRASEVPQIPEHWSGTKATSTDVAREPEELLCTVEDME